MKYLRRVIFTKFLWTFCMHFIFFLNSHIWYHRYNNVQQRDLSLHVECWQSTSFDNTMFYLRQWVAAALVVPQRQLRLEYWYHHKGSSSLSNIRHRSTFRELVKCWAVCVPEISSHLQRATKIYPYQKISILSLVIFLFEMQYWALSL